jgi:hypothetical protein
MELCIYHGINVQVEGLEGELISQMCQCTGRQSWCGGDQLNDWVCISNKSSFRLKHTGVPESGDVSDGTSYPLTENQTRPIAQAMG